LIVFRLDSLAEAANVRIRFERDSDEASEGGFSSSRSRFGFLAFSEVDAAFSIDE
jgi:hypothetical protein